MAVAARRALARNQKLIARDEVCGDEVIARTSLFEYA